RHTASPTATSAPSSRAASRASETAECSGQPTPPQTQRLRAGRQGPPLAALARDRIRSSSHERVGPAPPAALPDLLRRGGVKSRENVIAKNRERSCQEVCKKDQAAAFSL